MIDGLSPAQRRLKARQGRTREMVLAWLRENRGATRAAIARALGRPSSTVHHHLQVLERQHLVRVEFANDGAHYYAPSL